MTAVGLGSDSFCRDIQEKPTIQRIFSSFSEERPKISVYTEGYVEFRLFLKFETRMEHVGKLKGKWTMLLLE
jgi:hypothetical protein